jgi:superfamily II DNA/RNA helicase
LALKKRGIDARAMFSDLEQKERDAVMLDFRNGKIGVLVATDIVARGIDVDDIPLVINYGVPKEAEDYVHRIGRTARAENSGEAVTLVSVEDRYSFSKIERFLQKNIERLPLPEGMETPPETETGKKKGRNKGRGRGGRKNNRQKFARVRKKV